MKKIILLLFTVCFLQAVYAQHSKTDVAFDAFKERFLNAFWKANPEAATGVGYHVYDSILSVNNRQYRNMQVQFSKRFLDSLKAYSLAGLNDNNKTDFHLIEDVLKATAWQFEKAKKYEWDPSMYNIASSFAYILNEPFDKLENRLMNLDKKMDYVAAYYAAAKENIHNPAKELLDLSIEQNKGGLSVFETDLVDSVKVSSLPQQQKDLLTAKAKSVVSVINDFTAWLTTVPMQNARSFRLGKDLYNEQFAYEIESRYTVDELYNAAVERKAYLLSQMQEKARQVWKKYFGNAPKPADPYVLIRKVIDTVSTKHVKPEEFQQAIEEQLPKLAAFVKEKDLIYIDPSKPLKVRKEPGYMAGVAGASISAPGPYEKNVKTYYNVGSLAGWPAEKAESYLREYNYYTLQILNIHEGIPGHYVQLIYSNKSPSLIKSIFGNGSMVEGWAVYSELMMMENGYDNSPEMWLMYYKWNLRSVCNTILDISVHTKNMSRQDALDLLVRQAFQQQAEAEGKWRRVSVSQVQLTSYFNGFYEILQLRNDYKKHEGASYTDKKFNEQFLSYGSAPVKYIRQMMLGK